MARLNAASFRFGGGKAPVYVALIVRELPPDNPGSCQP